MALIYMIETETVATVKGVAEKIDARTETLNRLRSG